MCIPKCDKKETGVSEEKEEEKETLNANINSSITEEDDVESKFELKAQVNDLLEKAKLLRAQANSL